MTGLRSQVLLEPDDASLGPLLRIAADRLEPGAGYGRHHHRAVDVVAVVLDGSLRHGWGDGALMRAGDVAVLRAGTGLEHDEVAEEAGARVVQTYLRSARPDAAPGHEVHPASQGWVDLDRPDARLWVGRAPADGDVAVPAGLLVLAGPDGVRVERQDGGRVTGPGTVLVWQVDAARPAWAEW
ncbi:pirin family protein [Geodermatophilus sp. SYSU D00742]